MRYDLSPQRLLASYIAGIFPMADESGEVFWLAPDLRAVIELDQLKVSRSLRTTLRREKFELKVDVAFEEVLVACADRPDGTWISQEIGVAYCALRDLGYAHSVEAWHEGRLAGGLYGVAIGGAFFGESMFHRETDASKAALVHLVGRMLKRGMTLLDVQFMNPHLRSMGAVEIPRREYERRLQRAVRLPVSFGDRCPTLGAKAALTAYEG
jgi:leucyl/phenylalanyl-tRNA--protein transferase